MLVEQLYTNCLSEAAYFISDGKEAAVIDPLRDVDEYLKLAEEKGVVIKYIFETHFHADFVSGHLELAQKTGAPIIFGPLAQTGFKSINATDGQEFPLGNCVIKAIHTPRHTMESTCFLLLDEERKPHCIFTGDTLFVGDVGRPDLFSGNRTKEELAGMMFDSLQEKIVMLPDHVLVYPAHGPGSACGKKLGNEKSTTIGEQKKTNYALQPSTKEDFIAAITEGLSEPPVYFPINAKVNQRGYKNMEELIEKGNIPLSIDEVIKQVELGAILLDTRPATSFTSGFVPGSINIGLEGRFAEWAGNLLSYQQKIVLIAEAGMELESLVRLARVGFENVIGFLDGGFDAWQLANQEIDMIIDIEADELAMDMPHDQKLLVLDVRKEKEFEDGHVKGAMNVPLDTFTDLLNIANIDDEHNLYVHCAGGYRSVIAASILKKQGYHNLRNILGGFSQIKEEKRIPLVYDEK